TKPSRSTTIFPIPSLRPFHGSERASKRPNAGTQHRGHARPLHREQQRSDTPPPLRKLCDRTESLSLCALLSARRNRSHSRRLTVMRLRLGYRGLHFGHCDHRQAPDEEQEQRSENSERPDVGPNIYPCGMINSPGRWQEIAGEAAGDNDEALKPHASVHAHAHEEDDQDVVPAPSEPEQLRRQHVAKQHAKPPVPPVRAEDTGPKREPFVRITTVPGDDKFHRIGVANE